MIFVQFTKITKIFNHKKLELHGNYIICLTHCVQGNLNVSKILQLNLNYTLMIQFVDPYYTHYTETIDHNTQGK